MADGSYILIVGALLAVGLLASLLASRVRVPALILFLAVGMALGSDATGLDRLQRLPAGANRRDRRPGADPLRGRA